MSSAWEGEEVFFDSVEQLVGEDWVCGNSDYDIWLSEPESVRKRRQSFLSRMGFVDSSIFAEAEFERNCESHEAVSGRRSLPTATSNDKILLSERRKSNSEANCSYDYSEQDWLDHIITRNLVPADKCEAREVEDPLGKSHIISGEKKKRLRWLKDLVWKVRKNGNLPKESKLDGETGELSRVAVEHYRKRHMECTAVYPIQQVKAHDGLIQAMKFSPDGQYLASGGADGVVCIWRVVSKDASSPVNYCSFGKTGLNGKKTKKIQACVVVPEKIFHIEEKPLHKFRAHSGDVLDLAWSTSNHLLSSSMDKTVCLWRAGSDECLGVFHHSNYVTCVEFNPADESCFISGSIDGKVRIWGVSGRRVQDWVNVQDIVTAVCYQPNGQGFVVGSVSGSFRSYEISGDGLMLNAEINILGKRKSSGNTITGIQFLKNDSRRVMVTSDDSKIRILDGLEVVRKYKGLPKSGCQKSASFTSSGRHIVSVGDDSRIYLWNHDDMSAMHKAKQPKKTERSCETLLTPDGPSVVVPWWGLDSADDGSHKGPGTWDYNYFQHVSLSSWFSTECSSRTWPEERLPLPVWDFGQGCANRRHGLWGLVFVTGNQDGTIRTFQNDGLPVRI